ncbi:ABC transporter ATP-binding protein [Aneurinibacillus thermoaerophilus]|uniref:Heme ABC exporter, ATP-binding protein CcmA n=1 Tax=Aneurinibacillus thermoaerophilus TaxID=143495 RepID=A0A1G7XXS7_ANETH|nr:ABC transporter ATP-binding protein [Aneurinibacillus thermoaerophilus]MED0758068.1 ABC transporter ATP-binding protein [Aneurinibacillus thermoaerophilus]MED0761222.1 ABC transporter ATP-binding protein [Aneurinibacillus thermoaerophilus]SDG88826.1 heme ABC exporter, ATP-binding protein CcmA [Aneurinibacillus thermoaerophilus]
MTEPVLQVQDVYKMIENQTIVQSINMTLFPGQVIALCGGNGAGKSTIIRMIVGLSQPSKGSIFVKGIQWKQERERYAQYIGYMPDDYQFGNALSAIETLTFWAKLRGVEREQILETLEWVGLEEVKNQPVSAFSKGMRQRLLFAQALLSRPPLLVLDEPTNGLDPYWMDSFVRLVKGIKEKGHAVLFSTHQLHVAEAIADRVIFLRNGKIIQEGTIEEFRKRYGALGLHAAFSELFSGQEK